MKKGNEGNFGPGKRQIIVCSLILKSRRKISESRSGAFFPTTLYQVKGGKKVAKKAQVCDFQLG